MHNKTTEIMVAHTNRTQKKVTVVYYVTSVPGIIITKSDSACKKILMLSHTNPRA